MLSPAWDRAASCHPCLGKVPLGSGKELQKGKKDLEKKNGKINFVLSKKLGRETR